MVAPRCQSHLTDYIINVSISGGRDHLLSPDPPKRFDEPDLGVRQVDVRPLLIPAVVRAKGHSVKPFV